MDLDTVLDFARAHGGLTIAIQTIGLLCIRQIIVSLPSKEGRTSVARAKFGESLWFFIYYSLSFSTGLWYLWDKEWLWDPRKYWIGAALDIPEFPQIDHQLAVGPSFWPPQALCLITNLIICFLIMRVDNFYTFDTGSVGLQLIYTTQTAFYIAASIVVLFLSHARANHKDKLIMLAHHVVTITLLAVSYSFGQHRIGSVVLILHDVSDIFLEGAKLCRYQGWENITTPLFATFAAVFFCSRLIVFPTRVLYAIVTYFPTEIVYMVKQCNPNGSCTEVPLFSFNCAAFWLLLLGTLQCLHVYWFALIFRMIVRALREKHIEKDIRSDDESEELEETEKPASNGHKKHKTD